MDTLQREDRTKAFAIQIIRFVAKFPKKRIYDVLGHQLLKSGTSIGAHYREANRAESRADVTHKVGIVEKSAVNRSPGESFVRSLTSGSKW